MNCSFATGCWRPALVAQLPLLAGCHGLPTGVVAQIRQAEGAYQTGRIQQAESLLEPVIAAHPHQPGVEAAYYLRGLCRIRRGDTAGARRDFERALTSAVRETACRAHVQLGHIEYQRREFEAAAYHYGRAVADLPAAAPPNELYFRYGDCLQKLGSWDQARQVLARVWHASPDSPQAAAARQKFSWPYDYFTILCSACGPGLDQGFAAELAAAGLEVRMQSDVRRRPPAPQVFVGRFANFKDADAALKQVQRNAPDATIVP